jgi:hypothetical protein
MGVKFQRMIKLHLSLEIMRLVATGQYLIYTPRKKIGAFMLLFLFLIFAGSLQVISDILRDKYPMIEILGYKFQTMYTIYPAILIAELMIIWIVARRSKNFN